MPQHIPRSPSEPIPIELSTIADSPLFSDTQAAVAVVDRRGRWLAFNTVAARAVGGPEKIEGRTCFDFLAREYVEDRHRYVLAAIDDGIVSRVLGLYAGAMTVSAYRPAIDTASGTRLCLRIVQPLAGDESDHMPVRWGDPGVIIARVQDLGPLAALTARELELLALIGRGLSTSEIAARIHRSVKTIEWHRASIGAKLGGMTRVQLASLARRAGLPALTYDQIRDLRARSPQKPLEHPARRDPNNSPL